MWGPPPTGWQLWIPDPGPAGARLDAAPSVEPTVPALPRFRATRRLAPSDRALRSGREDAPARKLVEYVPTLRYSCQYEFVAGCVSARGCRATAMTRRTEALCCRTGLSWRTDRCSGTRWRRRSGPALG